MKKILMIIMIMLLISGSVFAESLDSNYIDLLFNKFSDLPEDEKASNIVLLELGMGSDVGLEVLYDQIVAKEDSMKANNITKADVRRNIDALKTWSLEDRSALVAAVKDNDKAAIKALNAKNAASAGGSGTTGIINEEKKITKELFIKSELPIIPELKGKQFKDTETHWSKDYVLFLVERNIISGKNEWSFDPEASISKAEIVTLVTKLIIEDVSKMPAYSGEIQDITEGKWYDGHMQRGFLLGLIAENDEGLLEPNHNSSREEVVEILVNALEVMEIPVSEELKVYKGDFKDFDKISEERREAMTIAINLGFISGKGDGILDPQSEIKRSEIAVVIKKLYSYILENM